MRTKLLLLLMVVLEAIIAYSMDSQDSFWIQYLHIVLSLGVFVLLGIIIDFVEKKGEKENDED